MLGRVTRQHPSRRTSTVTAIMPSMLKPVYSGHPNYDAEAIANFRSAFPGHNLGDLRSKTEIDCNAWSWLILDKPKPALRVATHPEIVSGVNRLFENMIQALEQDNNELENACRKDDDFWRSLLRYSGLRVSHGTTGQDYSGGLFKAFRCLIEIFEKLDLDVSRRPIVAYDPDEDYSLLFFEEVLMKWMKVSGVIGGGDGTTGEDDD